MAERLPRADDLRRQAREHRSAAERADGADTRKRHLVLADQLDELASTIKGERRAEMRR